jgi:hypothetical protein
MKLLMENWRKFLKEENTQGEYLGTGLDYPTLYRISTHTGKVRSSNKPADRDFYYTNSDGEIEHRIYFFSSEDEAKATIKSRYDVLSALIGGVKEDDDESEQSKELFLSTFKIPEDVEIFEDPEFGEDSFAVYGVKESGEKWSLTPHTITKAEDIKDEYEDYDDDYGYGNDYDYGAYNDDY